VPLASLTHTITQAVGDRGIYAIFLLMAVDAVFPAASELVMVYAGALAAGAIVVTLALAAAAFAIRRRVAPKQSR
jgi:hypothetical protein